MLIRNPNAIELASIREKQDKRLAELNLLETWTDYDFDLAYECYKVWWPIEKEWLPTGEGLSELIKNPRVPASKMARMKEAYNRIVNSKSFLSERQN